MQNKPIYKLSQENTYLELWDCDVESSCWSSDSNLLQRKRNWDPETDSMSGIGAGLFTPRADALSIMYYYKTKTKFQWLLSDKFTHLNIRKETLAVFLHDRQSELAKSDPQAPAYLQSRCVKHANSNLSPWVLIRTKWEENESLLGPSIWTTALWSSAKSRHSFLQYLVLLIHIQFHLWHPQPTTPYVSPQTLATYKNSLALLVITSFNYIIGGRIRYGKK